MTCLHHHSEKINAALGEKCPLCLAARLAEAVAELQNIANADTPEWEDPSEFEAWAKSRARHTLAKVTADSADVYDSDRDKTCAACGVTNGHSMFCTAVTVNEVRHD
jgi:hypothetical protein